MSTNFYSRILLLLLTVTGPLICFTQVEFTSSNLPIIVINTQGQTILDDPKITSEMGIIWNGPGMRNYLSDPFNDYDGKIGIEIRGSTSQQYPKKSYGVETRDLAGNNLNVNLLGLPKENDWILYGAYPDKTLMRNAITYHLFAQMQPWSPRFVYCELVINGEYLGVYALIEKIKRDDDRVDIAELEPQDNTGDALTGGYIIKIDKPTGSSNTSWASSYQNKLRFLYHDPKDTELTPTQRNYIQNYVADFEDALYGPNFKDATAGYRSFIDVGSFIDFMLLQELGKTVDGYRSSSFMYKDRDSKGGKLACGPMWDFNLSYGNANYCDAFSLTGWQYNFADVCTFNSEPPEWWPRLLEDPAFANELQCRWQELRATILSKTAIDNWIDSTAQYLNEGQQRNFAKWPILGEYVNWNSFIGPTYQSEIGYLKWWFEARSAYLDATLPGHCDQLTAVLETDTAAELVWYPNPTSGILRSNTPIAPDTDLRVYDLTGQEVQVERSAQQLDFSHLPSGMYLIKTDRQYISIFKQ